MTSSPPPPPPPESVERNLLLLCDTWSDVTDGIAGANRSLALTLATFKGIRVFVALFKQARELSAAARAELDAAGITLIGPATASPGGAVYTKANDDPLEEWTSLKLEVPDVTHILGHAPITARAALRLKERAYPNAKTVLFFHVVAEELAWLVDQVPFHMPSEADLVQLAQRADVVYSVTEKVHFHNTAKFRNEATEDIDHRLFLPECAASVFGVQRSRLMDASKPRILVLGDFIYGVKPWQGLDIAMCAVSKVVENEDAPNPVVVIGGVPDTHRQAVKDIADQYPQVTAIIKSYAAEEDLRADLEDCTLCIVPARAEPYGNVGRLALSAGIPTLVPEECVSAPVIKRLTTDPGEILVPVITGLHGVRQCATTWAQRIVRMLRNPDKAAARAADLQLSLRRDEPTKEAYDNVITYILGGISVFHESVKVVLLFTKDVEAGEDLALLRSFNEFLTTTMKQSWRLKHHPLTTEGDLPQLLLGIDLPIKKIMEAVTDKIEEHDRRIVSVNEENGGFVVYCPTVEALTDLWAMCDVINKRLERIVEDLEYEKEMLRYFKLKAASIRTSMHGKEYLKYKQYLIDCLKAGSKKSA